MEKKRLVSVFAFIILIAISLLSVSLSESEKIDKKVLDSLSENDRVNVIIKSDSPIKGEQIFDGLYAAKISKQDIEELENNQEIESIVLDGKKHILLQDTTVIINATKTWPVKLSGYNLTGIGQTVCIIDTGINSSHPDLLGKVIGGYDFVNNDNDPSDDEGHGTHVAGIVAANSSIHGVAPGASLISIKACDASGSCDDADIIAGINWCIDNSTIFNISVISISIGGNVNFTSYCDSSAIENSNLYASPINSAIAKNISVVISAGNNGNFTAMSSPACIENSTSVAATTKADVIASYSNRNSLTDLAAPGSNVNSTCLPGDTGYTNGYCLKSGTSMSAPHVSAAIAIMQESRKLQFNKSYTPSEAVLILQQKGRQINDTAGNGLNYSRINVYSSIDPSAPIYSNISSSIAYKSLFNITWTDDFNVSTVTATFNNTNYTAVRNNSLFILNTTFAAGNYTLIWTANDTFGNTNQTDILNVTISQLSPNVVLKLNVSGAVYSQSINVNNNTVINISATSAAESAIQLYMNNSLINQGVNISNSSAFTVGIYNMTALYAGTQNYSSSVVAYFITVESPLQGPAAYKIAPANSTYSASSVILQANATDASLKNITLYLWNSTSQLDANSTNITGIFNQTSWSYSLNDSVYSWNVYACDNSSNCNWAADNSTLTVDTINPQVAISIDDTTITTAESSAITCSATDTNLANLTILVDNAAKNSSSTNSSSLTVSYSYSGSAGDHTVNCSAYDKANDYNQSSSTITISTASTGSSGSSSSSNDEPSSEPETHIYTSYSVFYQIVKADDELELSPYPEIKASTSVSEIVLESSIDLASFSLKIYSVNSSNVTAKLNNAYSYFEITTKNLDYHYLTTAEINFEVNKSWFDKNNLSVNTTELNRYSDGAWQALNTTLTGSTSRVYKFRSETPGFSVFAITANKTMLLESENLSNETAELNATLVQEQEGLQAAKKSIFSKWWFWTIIGMLAALGIEELVAYLLKPKGHHRYHPKAKN